MDDDPIHSVRIVAAPNLRGVIEHTGVKSSPSSAAPLDQHIRVARQQLFQKLIDSKNIPVQDGSLVFRVRRIYVKKTSVHIPLDIFHIGVSQHLADLFKYCIPDFGPRKIHTSWFLALTGFLPGIAIAQSG